MAKAKAASKVMGSIRSAGKKVSGWYKKGKKGTQAKYRKGKAWGRKNVATPSRQWIRKNPLKAAAMGLTGGGVIGGAGVAASKKK
jgi:hypothetical protein